MRWGFLGLGISVLGLFSLGVISMNIATMKTSWEYLGLTTDIIAVITAIGIFMAVLGHRNWRHR